MSKLSLDESKDKPSPPTGDSQTILSLSALDYGYSVGSKESGAIYTQQPLRGQFQTLLHTYFADLEAKGVKLLVRIGGVAFFLSGKKWKDDPSRLNQQVQVVLSILDQDLGYPVSIEIGCKAMDLLDTPGRRKLPDTVLKLVPVFEMDPGKQRLYYTIQSKSQEAFELNSALLNAAIQASVGQKAKRTVKFYVSSGVIRN